LNSFRDDLDSESGGTAVQKGCGLNSFRDDLDFRYES